MRLITKLLGHLCLPVVLESPVVKSRKREHLAVPVLDHLIQGFSPIFLRVHVVTENVESFRLGLFSGMVIDDGEEPVYVCVGYATI